MLDTVRAIRAHIRAVRPFAAIVTTQEEFDAALAKADQITVEGDDALLSYAINKAAADPENRVTFEATGAETSVSVEGNVRRGNGPAIVVASVATRAERERRAEEERRAAWAALGRAEEERQAAEAALGRAEEEQQAVEVCLGDRADNSTLRLEATPSPAARVRSRTGWLVVAACAVIVFLFVVGLALWQWPRSPIPTPPGPPIHIPPAPPITPSPSEPATDFWANLPSVLWPLVAIVAILALFLIARQAISSGSNVTFQWKVTEKVSGRVVITKVRERAPKKAAAA
jgi:hypothetical protein